MTNEDAIKWIDNLKNDLGNPHYECLWPYAQGLDEICEMLEEQEPIQPKMGKWITRLRHEHYPSGKPYEEDFCSECGKRGSLEYPFCPWCGIKMEGGEVG